MDKIGVLVIAALVVVGLDSLFPGFAATVISGLQAAASALGSMGASQ